MQHLRFVALAALVGTVGLAAACSVYDESLLNAGGGSSTSSGDGGEDGGDGGAGPTTTTAVTGQGSTGTVTTGGGCQTVDDCPGDDSACAVRACTDGTCSIEAEVQGFPVPDQTPGDCVQLVCDGAGGIETVNDDADIPDDDGNECTASVCSAGTPDHVAVAEGDPCSQEGGQLCLGDACVECLGDGDCEASDRCSEANTCVSPQCDDGILNGNETDTDCGGGTCAGCALGDDCDGPGDCLSGACNGTCQPSCTDGIMNNGETAPDCGGPSCSDCGLGLGCASDLDCDSDQCLASVCRPRLYFSEYVEGSGQNKALEITNYGNVPLDFVAAACSVRYYANGSTEVEANIGLTGTVDALEVHVLAKSGGSPVPSPTLIALADQTSGSLAFSGNDAIELVCGGVIIDSIGQVGNDPGATTGWGVDPANTYNNTLRRKSFVSEGDPISTDAFDPATEWDGFAIDTFDGLGDP